MADLPSIRVFVSATFADTHNERDLLARRIFPMLRRRCKDRKSRLIDVDLRWGVPANTTPARTLEICLSELERCEAHNGHAFVVCVVGERYGWVPPDSALLECDEKGQVLQQRFSLVQGRSVTHHEMAFALRNTNPHALCFIRNSDFLDHPALRGHNRAQWVDTGEKLEKLNAFKAFLRNHPANMAADNYACTVERVDSSGAVVLQGLDADFASAVTNRLWAAMDSYLTKEERGVNALAPEVAPHVRALAQHRNLVGRDDVLYDVLSALERDLRVVVLVGEAGSGKSAVLCHVLDTCAPEACVSFFDLGDELPTPLVVMRSLASQIAVRLEELGADDDLPVAFDEEEGPLRAMLSSLLARWVEVLGWQDQAPTIGIDNLDRLLLASDSGNCLAWLPENIPGSVTIVTGASPPLVDEEGASSLRRRLRRRLGIADAVTDAQWFAAVPLGALSAARQATLVEHVLGEYNKSLSPMQLDTLLQKQHSGVPLYLALACEELRLFGNFEKLDERIGELAGTTEELCVQILARLELEHGRDAVGVVLTLVALAGVPLFETEVRDVAAAILYAPARLPGGAQPEAAERAMFPGSKWAHLWSSVSPFLSFNNDGRNGESARVRLDEMKQAVLASFNHSLSEHTKVHSALADYFSALPLTTPRTVHLVLLHSAASGKHDTLVQALSSLAILTLLWTHTHSQHLLYSHWLLCGGMPVAAQCYLRLLDQACAGEGDDGLVVDVASVEDVRRDLCSFLVVGHMYHDAMGVWVGVMNDWGVVCGIIGEKAEGIDLEDVEAASQFLLALGNKAQCDGVGGVLLGNDLMQFGECIRKLDMHQVAAAAYQAASNALAQEGSANLRVSLMTKHAELLAKIGHYDDALQGYEEACALAAQDLRVQADLLENLGELYRKLGKLESARQVLGKAADIVQDLSGRDSCWKVKMNLGEVWFKEGNYDQCQAEYEDALGMATRQFGKDSLPVSKVLTNLGELELKRAEYGKALKSLETSLAIKRAQLGDDHASLAKPLNLFGEVLHKRGDFDRAFDVLNEALVLRERTFGEGCAESAKVLNQLGEVRLAQGRLDDAERFFGQALQIREDTLGPDHTEVCKVLNNVADVHKARGHFEKALEVYSRAYRVRELNLGPDHVDTAKVLCGVALMHHKLGKYDMAERRFQAALEVMEAKLGRSHPNVATVLFRLAKVNIKGGKYQQALSLVNEAVVIRTRTLGAEHPDVAEVVTAKAEVLFKMGRLDECLPLYLDTLHIREKAKLNSGVAESLNNLGELYQAQGQLEDAASCYTRALAIRQQNRPPPQWTDCTETAKVLNNMGSLFAAMGKRVQAASLLLKALEMRERLLGLEHHDLAKILTNIGKLLDASSDDERRQIGSNMCSQAKIRKFFTRALGIRKKYLGEDHPQVAEVLMSIAEHHVVHGQPYLAERQLHRAFEIQHAALGLSHPTTVASCNQLLAVYTQQDKHFNAEKFLVELVAMCRAELGFGDKATQRWAMLLVEHYQRVKGKEAKLSKFVQTTAKQCDEAGGLEGFVAALRVAAA